MATKIIKTQFNQDVRRFSVSETTTFEQLFVQITDIYKLDGNHSSLSLKYTDDEGDLISVSSERELEEAFRLVKDGGILRVHIVQVEKSKKEQSCGRDETANSNSNGSFLDVLEKLVIENPLLRNIINDLEIEVKSIPENLKDLKNIIFLKLMEFLASQLLLLIPTLIADLLAIFLNHIIMLSVITVILKSTELDTSASNALILTYVKLVNQRKIQYIRNIHSRRLLHLLEDVLT